MRILIIEDLEEKCSQIIATLKSTLAHDLLTIDRAKSFRGGVKKLEGETYDVLVLEGV